MSLENKISQTVPDESVRKITAAIDVIKAELPFLLNLTLEERKTLPKMGDRTVAFVQKSLEYAKQNPASVPSFLNVAEFEKDVELVSDLSKVLFPLEQLVELVDDTTMLAGSEAYAAALVYYNAVKAAAKGGLPGMKTVVDDLSARFPGRSASQSATVASKN